MQADLTLDLRSQTTLSGNASMLPARRKTRYVVVSARQGLDQIVHIVGLRFSDDRLTRVNVEVQGGPDRPSEELIQAALGEITFRIRGERL